MSTTYTLTAETARELVATITCGVCGEILGPVHCPLCRFPSTETGAYSAGWDASNGNEPRRAPYADAEANALWLAGYDGCDVTAQFNEPDGDNPAY